MVIDQVELRGDYRCYQIVRVSIVFQAQHATMNRCFFSILLWTISASAFAPAKIPACAQSAINSGIRGSGCATDNFSCICASENLNFALESAGDFCNDADQETLYHAIWDVCRESVLGTRDIDEDDTGATPGEVQEDTPSPTVASEGTDQATLGTPILPSTPTVASEGTDQATLGNPVPAVPANAPTVATEGTDQATLGTPAPASTPTLATENPYQATLSTPTLIAAPTTPLPTSATSLVTDTREFSHPSSLDSSNVVTTQQAADPNADPNGRISATTTSPGPEVTALLSSNATRNNTSSLRGQDQSSIMGEAGSEVAVSVGALVVAVAGLTWVFAEF
jgi:hypothetical protein